MIVADDAGFAEQMAAILADQGYACQSATSGRAALGLLAGGRPNLIILDHSLADMSGDALIERMEEQGHPIPFVMLIGQDDAGLALTKMKSSACDYMHRDGSFLKRLPAVVARALHEAEIRERLQRAEISLRQSETRLARAQKIARLGTWEWDPGSGEVYLSEELGRIFGLMPGESSRIDLKSIFRQVHPLDRSFVRKAFIDASRNGQPFNISYRINNRSEGEIIVNSQGEVELGEDGQARLISGTTLDITARIQAESEIQQLINYDTLTGLPNRNLLHDRLTLTIAQAHREHQLVGVLSLDLDRFKWINETLGHRIGDKLLQSLADRMSACVRESDTLARLGGDEFVIILAGVSCVENITLVAKKILGLVSEPAWIDSHEIYTTASIGIAVYPMDGEDSHTLLKYSDLAMYQTKEHDRNNFQFFSAEMNSRAQERMMLENSMRKALEREEFFLLYQPQVDASSGRIIGVEALLRWNHPELGLVGPDKFIYLAEETGFIVPLGEWVLQRACRQNRAWQDQGLAPLRVSVNLSGKQFGQKGLDEMISATLMETGLDPQWLELEITESAIMKNAEVSILILSKIREMGIALAIDDFGTGYSSLSYLKHFPITRLKIDRSFVKDITTNSDDAAIAEIIIAIARTFKLSVIAEGVETRPQMEFFIYHRCVEMQGYLFSRPVTAEQFARLLENGINY
jgi:diguanylate cyclase (GGDEF)-like protein